MDVAEIQEAINDELKKIQKEAFFGSFSETVRPRQSLYIYVSGAYFQLRKKLCVFLMCLQFLNKSVLKLLDCTVYLL